MPQREADQIKDLARKIGDLTREHPAYSMAWEIVSNTIDHLSAKARVIEINNDPKTCDKWGRCGCGSYGQCLD